VLLGQVPSELVLMEIAFAASNNGTGMWLLRVMRLEMNPMGRVTKSDLSADPTNFVGHSIFLQLLQGQMSLLMIPPFSLVLIISAAGIARILRPIVFVASHMPEQGTATAECLSTGRTCQVFFREGASVLLPNLYPIRVSHLTWIMCFCDFKML
jgi:hypothetical protein